MSDLIDRKNAIDVLQILADKMTDEGKTVMEQAISVLRDLSAETERKWIPVTEALPKDGRQVLVYAQSVHYALAKYDEMRQPDGKWIKEWVTFDAWKPYYIIENVIAWMPLPEPRISHE